MDFKQVSFWDKPRIKFIKDNLELHKSFLCGSEHQYLFEHENNYIIKIDGTYYGPLKDSCEKIA